MRSLAVAFARHVAAGETDLVREAALVARERAEPAAAGVDEVYGAGAFAALGTFALAWCDILAERESAAHGARLAQDPQLLPVVQRLAGGEALAGAELAEALGTSAPTMSRRLEELRKLGIVEVWAPLGADARTRPHRLTALGSSLATSISLPAVRDAEAPPISVSASSATEARHLLRRITVDLPELYAGHERPLFHRSILASLAATTLLDQRSLSQVEITFAQTLHVICSRPATETTGMGEALYRTWEGMRGGAPEALRMRRFGSVLADMVARPLSHWARRSEELLTLLRQERHASWVPLACHAAIEHARASEEHRAALLALVQQSLAQWAEHPDPLLALPSAHWLGMAQYLQGQDPTHWDSTVPMPAPQEGTLRTRVLRELLVSAKFNRRLARFERGASACLVDGLVARFDAPPEQAALAVDVGRSFAPEDAIVGWSVRQRDNVDVLLREFYRQDAGWRGAVDELGAESKELAELTREEGSNTALHTILDRARRMSETLAAPSPPERASVGDEDRVAADNRGLFTSPLLSAWAPRTENVA
ncbi:MAG: hypothetical protein Q8P41_08505 [Pseudomonadota bacterium]|nr:hypothetical protein [Pseudomonadota bacterium]